MLIHEHHDSGAQHLSQLYPEDPELEVEYIMQRFKRMCKCVSDEEWASQQRQDPTTDYFKVHSAMLYKQIIQAPDDLARMRGTCDAGTCATLFRARSCQPTCTRAKR